MKLMGVIGLLVVGCAIAVVVLFAVKAAQSKHGAPAGLADGRLAACSPKPNCVSSEAGTPGDKAVVPLPATRQERDWERFQGAVRALGGEIVRTEADYLAATFTSPLFGFVDDLEARLDRDGGVIHVRSASRVGHSDLGANRARVERLRERYAEALR